MSGWRNLKNAYVLQNAKITQTFSRYAILLYNICAEIGYHLAIMIGLSDTEDILPKTEFFHSEL
jgi:hypothetical protein